MSDNTIIASLHSTCVVIDTSVWCAELLLRSPLAVTLIYDVVRRGAVIGLPEVLEEELKPAIVRLAMDYANETKKPLRMLRTLVSDFSLGYNVPSESKVASAVDARIAELEPKIIRLPLSLEQARAALAMVNAKVPPNVSSQQFKDSAIWQAVLSFATDYSVILVTMDAAFFEGGRPEKGPAKNILEDCGTGVKVFFGIPSLLKVLREVEPTFDRKIVQALLEPAVLPAMINEAERNRLTPTFVTDCTIDAFPTRDSDRLAIDYTMTFDLACRPEDLNATCPDRGIVHGSSYFMPEIPELQEHFVQRIELKGPGILVRRDFRDYENEFPISRPLPE